MSNRNTIDRSWVFGSREQEAKVKPLCQRVEAEFDLTSGRLCRYFAESDDSYLVSNPYFGQHFRGFHATVESRNAFPQYIRDRFFHPFNMLTTRETSPTFDEMVAFDSLIYVRKSTCDDPTGLVECYAHELQHFVQRWKMPRVYAVNNVLYRNLKRFDLSTTVIDIPTEREANIVSKRVAEVVCGVEAVNAFADAQVRLMDGLGESEQRERWTYFRDMSSSAPFDLLESTKSLVEKYKGVLDFGIDVSADQWWIGNA